jgi:hypothetical protein
MAEGLRAGEYWLARNSQCIGSIGAAAATIAGDSGFLLGAGALLRAGMLAASGGRVAADFAQHEVTRHLAPATIQQSQAWANVALSTGGSTLAEHAVVSTATNAASAYGGSRLSVRSWVPGVASADAIGQVRQRCQ